MKLSNFLLSIIAASLLSLTTYSSAIFFKVDTTPKISVGNSSSGYIQAELPSKLTDRQAQVLSLAYNIAKVDGHKDPKLLQAIVYQESKAGQFPSYKVAGQSYGLTTNNRYYGLSQIKLSAAKDVLKRWPEMKGEFKFQTDTDEEIIAKLIENDKFNLSVASKYLLLMSSSYGYSGIREIALAFNQGPGGAKKFNSNDHPYSNGVVNNLKFLNDI